MVDLEQYTETKWTGRQKRDGMPLSYDIFADQSLMLIPKPDADTVEKARIVIQRFALDPADEAVLLDMLGIAEDGQDVCGDYAGTIRGLNIHLSTYTRPCNACAEIRMQEEEASRWRLDTEESND